MTYSFSAEVSFCGEALNESDATLDPSNEFPKMKWSLVKYHNVSFVRLSLSAGIKICSIFQKLETCHHRTYKINHIFMYESVEQVAIGLFTLVVTQLKN